MSKVANFLNYTFFHTDVADILLYLPSSLKYERKNIMKLSINFELNFSKLWLWALLSFGIWRCAVLKLRTAEKFVVSAWGSASWKHKQQVLSKQCHLFTKSHNTYNRRENLLSLTYQKPLRYTYPDRSELLWSFLCCSHPNQTYERNPIFIQ